MTAGKWVPASAGLSHLCMCRPDHAPIETEMCDSLTRAATNRIVVSIVKMKTQHMLTITQQDYLTATGLQSRIASMRFSGLAYRKAGRVNRYYLADVLPLLNKKYARSAKELLAVAQDDGQPFVGGDDVLPSCAALEEWLTDHISGARWRIYQIRTTFAHSLGAAMRSSGLTGDSERLRRLILRDSAVLPYLLTADRASLPISWVDHARRFAIIHAAPSPFEQELVERAA